MSVITIVQLPEVESDQLADDTVVPVALEDGTTLKLRVDVLKAFFGQLILSGAVTGTGSPFDTIETTLADAVVGLPKLAPVASARLLGRTSVGDGPVELITVGPGLILAGGVLNTAAAQNASDVATLFDHRNFGGL